MRKFVLITLVVAFSSIYYFSSVENENSLAFKAKNEIRKLVSNGSSGWQGSTFDSRSVLKDSAISDSKGADFEQISDLSQLNEAQFANWVVQESKSMDSTQNDSQQVETRLRSEAQTLNSNQLEQLEESAISTKVAANERIFSGYLLSLANSKEALDTQYDLAKSALPDFGTVTPHSEAELRHSQELALRYMQIDEWASKANTDTNARDKLMLLVTSAESEEVRKYAARKLKDLTL